jgi:hypothetical protein
MRLHRTRGGSKPVKTPVARLAPKWSYRYQRQHGQFEYTFTLGAMNVSAVAMRTCRHGGSPLRSSPIRDRKLPSLNIGTQCGFALAHIDRPPLLDHHHVQIVGRRGREKVPSPQPWLQGALSLLSPFVRHSRSGPKPKLSSFAHHCKCSSSIRATRATASNDDPREHSRRARLLTLPASSPQLRCENEANRECVHN